MATSIPSNAAWVTVFLPALVYFLTTRMHQLGASSSVVVDQVVVTESACKKFSNVLYTSSCQEGTGQLRKTLDLVQSAGLNSVTASFWRHDEELGRGYLLLSDGNQIWRYEVGGGPIAIGKSLQLDQSACRSKPCQQNITGGLAIDFSGNSHAQQGRLLVAEWGEGRIVRLEDNGARTPLVLTVDNCHNLTEPVQATQMIISPFGDLWFLHESASCQERSLWHLPAAVHVPPLASLRESRTAHAWTTLDTIEKPRKVLTGNLGGMAVPADWSKLYVTSKNKDDVLLLEVPLQEEEEDDDEEKTDNEAENITEPKVVFNLTKHVVWVEAPGLLEVSKDGTFFWSTDKGVLVLDLEQIVTFLPTPKVTALTLGGDSYLYVSTAQSLLRMRTRLQPVALPTNLVVGRHKA